MMIALWCLTQLYLNYFYSLVVSTSLFSRMIIQLLVHRNQLRDIDCCFIDFLYQHWHFHSFSAFFTQFNLFAFLLFFLLHHFLAFFHYYYFLVIINYFCFLFLHFFCFHQLHLQEQITPDLLLNLFFQFLALIFYRLFFYLNPITNLSYLENI